MIWFFISEASEQTYWKKMNYCNTSQEAYIKAFCVEHMLKRSRMGQGKTEERKYQQRTKPHAVETHFLKWIIPHLSFVNFSPQMIRTKSGVGLRNSKHGLGVENRSVNLVIDSGSAMNLVAQEVLEKLHQPIESHRLDGRQRDFKSNNHQMPIGVGYGGQGSNRRGEESSQKKVLHMLVLRGLSQGQWRQTLT